ncbi:MAG TPA: hypothetical protein QGI72_01320 [Poseidonia sp.]|nr:hypothetical protein [Poseidonia sp.]
MAHQHLLPNEIIEYARSLKQIALLGDSNIDHHSWLSIITKLEKDNWEYFIVDPAKNGLKIKGKTIHSTLEEINEDLGVILLMDTTQKKKWMDIISYRMEVRGDIELIWSHLGCEIEEIDKKDFHAYGWSFVHNEALLDHI